MSRPGTGGFTLLEVLVAMAIIGIALTALIKVTAQSADTSAAIEQRIRARWVAQSQLALARATQSFPAVGERRGEAQMNGATFEWFQRVTATPNPRFRKATIQVSFNGDMLFELATLLQGSQTTEELPDNLPDDTLSDEEEATTEGENSGDGGDQGADGKADGAQRP